MDTEIGAAPLVPQEPQEPRTIRDGLRQAIRDTGDDIARQFDQRLQSNFALAIRTKPELAAEAQDIARQLGVAPGAIEGNLEVAREVARRRSFRQRDFARSHPVLATALQDIEFAKVAQDDLDNLAGTEGFFRRLGMAWGLGKLQNAQGYAGARLMQAQLSGQPEDVVDQRRLEWIRDQLMTLPESQGILQNTFEVLGQMSETIPVALGAGAAAAGVASLGGPIGAGTAAAWGTGTALFGQTAVIEGGNAYAEMVAQGLDKDAAARAAIGVGLVNGALEVVGEEASFGLAAAARKALSKRITKEVASALVEQTVGKAAMKAAGRYATGVAAEVSTEVLQEVTNVLAERAAGGDPQNIEQRLVDIAAKTAQGMALLGAVNPGTRFAIDARRAARARQLQETFTQPLVDAATASATAQRSPDAFRAFVQQAAQGTGGETAYIDGRRFGEVLQQLKVTDDQLEEAVPGITDQIQTAIETGGDVALPTADLAAKLGRTDLLTALAPHVRLDPDAMSFADAEAFQAAQKEQQQAAATAVESEATRSQDFRRSLEQVRTQMRDELRTTIRELRDEVAQVGRDAKKGQRLREADAGALATVYANTIGSLAMRAGMLPHEFAAAYPLSVAPQNTQNPQNQSRPSHGDSVVTRRDSAGGQEPLQQGAQEGATDTAAAPVADAGQKSVGGQRLREPSGATDGATDASVAPLRSGSRGSFDPKALRLFLSTEADPTTFLHELSHFYLSILGDLAARPDAPAAITADMETLLQWWGVPDLSTWNSMTLEQQRKHHEAFAYSFEGYLFDGKAPSAALRRVFGRIAAWFRQVYRGLRDRINRVYREAFGADLPALTPEVRAVFDRMLASEDEIAAAQQVHGMAAVFESQAQAGATDAQWADYLAAQEDATNAAIDEHSRDSLRQMQWLTGARSRVLRELQAQHKALRAGVREDVEAELRVQPVHRARQWLVHGEMVDVDGTSAGKVDGVHKIDLEALRPYLPAGAEKRVTGRNGIAAAKGGMDPATAATLFGFPDAATMVRELLAAPKLEDAVEAATDERMLEEHGDLADPKRRERLVEEALHNELRTRQIAVEQRLLTKAAQPVRVLTAAAKEAAERIVGRQKVWLVDPKAHSVAEARAGRDIGEALRKGDAVAAVAAQRNRMLQHQLVKAAVQALDDVQTAEEQAAQFYERDDQVSERRDIDLVYVGRALAARWGFGPKLQGQEQQLAEKALATVRADNPQLASMVDGWIDRQTTQGGTYREMSVADLRELHTVLEGVWSLAGEAKTIEIEGRRAQVKAAGERLAMHIAEKPERAPSASAAAGATPSPWARLVLKGWNVFAHLKRFTFWARFMDGAAAGPFHAYFVQPILAATQRYRAARDEMVSAVHPRILELRSAAGSRWDADIAAPELGHTFRGKKEIVGALLHAGSHSNLEKLLVGYGWAEPPKEGEVLDTSKWDRFLARMFQEGVLTQQDTEFAAFIWGLYAKQLPENQRTHKALYGFEFHAIEHRQVRTPFGVLEGGYVPAYADRDATDLRLGQIADTIEGDAAAFTYSVSTGRGHTLARNPFYRKPLALDLAQQVRHMDAQLRFTFVQPALKGVMRVVRQRDFSNAMNAYDREAVNSIILPWLENVALQATTRPSGMPLIDTAATMLRRVSSLAALGFNLGNALIQSTGIANSIAVVKGRWMRAGLAAMSNPAAALRFATERSAWMQDRLSQRAETMREDIQRAGSEQPLPFLPADFVRGWKATSRALDRAALLPQRFTQGFVDLVTWHGAYQQAMAEAKADGTVTLEQAEKAAAEAADAAVRHTQGGGGPEDLAAYEAGTPVMKLLTQFGSYSNVVLNSVLAAGDTRTQRAAAALWVLLVPALLEPTIRMLLVGAPDDDDGDGRMDELAALYAGGVVRNVVGLVPGAGPMALAMAESDGKRVLSSPAASTMQAAFRGVAGLADMVTGERAPTGADARAWAQLMTMLTGMPLVPVGRAAGYALDVEAGKRKPTGTADYLRGLVVGR